MKWIQKFFGICEHKWIIHRSNCRIDHYEVRIMCGECCDSMKIKSDYFTKSNNWCNVKKSFIIKLNKEYNLNLTVRDL